MVGYRGSVPEQVCNTISNTSKSYMKVARVVCQQLNRSITLGLSNVISIGPHWKVLDIFTSRSQHEIYGKCITEPVYDGGYLNSGSHPRRVTISTPLTCICQYQRLEKKTITTETLSRVYETYIARRGADKSSPEQ